MKQTLQELKEKYCKTHGWEKIKGYKINVEGVEPEWDDYYIPQEAYSDYIRPCDFWSYEDLIHEDVDQVIEYIEDHIEDDNEVLEFERWKKIEEEVIRK